jgi:hypothetical protein
MFEPIWNRIYINNIQITMAESFGVQDRGNFYDETGAIRDVFQNHMLQVLANLTMDPPKGEESDAVRDQKAALLKAVRPLDPARMSFVANTRVISRCPVSNPARPSRLSFDRHAGHGGHKPAVSRLCALERRNCGAAHRCSDFK